MAEINGNDLANTLTGTAAGDLIRGLGGNDSIAGLDGNDVLYGDGKVPLVIDGGVYAYNASYAPTATFAGAGTASAIVFFPFEPFGNDFIDGGNGNDSVYGGDGNDALRGGEGSDTLYGGNGDDALRGGTDRDTIYGGAGIDEVRYEDAAFGVEVNLLANLAAGGAGIDTLSSIENVIGSFYDDALIGDNLGNRIKAESGNDQVFGLNGNDALNGDAGNDRIYGGDGDDGLSDIQGSNVLDGGAGVDRVWYGAATVHLSADLASGAASLGGVASTLVGIEHIVAANSTNYLLGNGAANQFDGGGYADFMDGRAGNDYLFGQGGNDTLYGNDGNDYLDGSTGNDALYGQAGNDTANGGAGDDIITDGSGANFLNGGDGNDTINGSGTLNGGAGDDTIYGVGAQVIYGGSGHDQIHLAAGAQRVDYDSKDDDAATPGTPLYPQETVFNFNGAGGDRIDVSGIDANENVAGNQAFTFVAPGTVNQAGEIGLLVQGGVRFLVAQTDNVAGNDLVLEIANNAVINDGFIIN